MFKDVLGHELEIGDRVGVVVVSANAYGKIRVATIYSLEPTFRVIWEGNIKPSNPMRFLENRIIVLP